MAARYDNPYAELVAAGCRIENYESDLYVADTPEAREIIQRTLWAFEAFNSPKDGTPWLAIAFAFTPWWDARAKATFNYEVTGYRPGRYATVTVTAQSANQAIDLARPLLETADYQDADFGDEIDPHSIDKIYQIEAFRLAPGGFEHAEWKAPR